eukprot:Amastigsp_a952_278.p2 type:complete len:247 gc:universal Amastigsp_a952_278:1483-743(-)
MVFPSFPSGGVAVALVALLLAMAHVRAAQTPPVWPPAFTTNWTMYWAWKDSDKPPYSPRPEVPYWVGTGSTFYSFNGGNNVSQMLEVYRDFCIPIFPNATFGPCNFLNAADSGGVNTAWLIFSPGAPSEQCCVFGRPWHPPAPNFLVELGSKVTFGGNHTLHGKSYSLFKFGGPPAGPFGYGFFDETVGGFHVPAVFDFAALGRVGDREIGGWTEQQFTGWAPQAPPAGIFTVPDSCQKATQCEML